MKHLKILFILLLIGLISCDKNDFYKSPDSIIAGQKSSSGIYYYDYTPDLALDYAYSSSSSADTSIYIDLNLDSKYDFEFRLRTSPSSLLGMSSKKVVIIPLENNEVSIVPNDNKDLEVKPCMSTGMDYTKALTANEMVNNRENWSNEESLIYYGSYIINNCEISEGYWSDSNTGNESFIGVKVRKFHKTYYGWISLYRDDETRKLKIADYSIMKDFVK